MADIAERSYDIHGVVRLSVRGTTAVLTEVDHHLNEFAVAQLSGTPDIVIAPYHEAPPTPPTTVVDDYRFGDDALDNPDRRVRIALFASPIQLHADRLALPINLLIQFALMRNGRSFVHGAGLEIDGRTILFPAYPGTGKTTIVSAMVARGAQFFGDDLCIVGGGDLGAFPQALSVYPHHLPILNYDAPDARRAFRRTAMLDRIINLVGPGRSLPARGARVILSALRTPAVNVPPARVFGAAHIAATAPLREVVALQRAGTVSTLTEQSATAEELAEHATAVLWHEWHASFHDLLLYDALARNGGSLPRWFEDVRATLTEAFRPLPVARILIPAHWDNQTLITAFPDFWQRRTQANVR